MAAWTWTVVDPSAITDGSVMQSNRNSMDLQPQQCMLHVSNHASNMVSALQSHAFQPGYLSPANTFHDAVPLDMRKSNHSANGSAFSSFQTFMPGLWPPSTPGCQSLPPTHQPTAFRQSHSIPQLSTEGFAITAQSQLHMHPTMQLSAPEPLENTQVMYAMNPSDGKPQQIRVHSPSLEGLVIHHQQAASRPAASPGVVVSTEQAMAIQKVLNSPQENKQPATHTIHDQGKRSSKSKPVNVATSFEEYEAQYGPALRCDAGPCTHDVQMPCVSHRCVCCKLGRQVNQYSRQGWCGPCGRREVVGGLKFVRCGRCKAEMLEETYTAHLKQNVTIVDAEGRRVAGRCVGSPSEEVETDKGRRCGKCTNMRPLTFYSNSDSNCTCNMHLPLRLATVVKTEETRAKKDNNANANANAATNGLNQLAAVAAAAGRLALDAKHPSLDEQATVNTEVPIDLGMAAIAVQAQHLHRTAQAAVSSCLLSTDSLATVMQACQQVLQLLQINSNNAKAKQASRSGSRSSQHTAAGLLADISKLAAVRTKLEAASQNITTFTKLLSDTISNGADLVPAVRLSADIAERVMPGSAANIKVEQPTTYNTVGQILGQQAPTSSPEQAIPLAFEAGMLQASGDMAAAAGEAAKAVAAAVVTEPTSLGVNPGGAPTGQNNSLQVETVPMTPTAVATPSPTTAERHVADVAMEAGGIVQQVSMTTIATGAKNLHTAEPNSRQVHGSPQTKVASEPAAQDPAQPAKKSDLSGLPSGTASKVAEQQNGSTAVQTFAKPKTLDVAEKRLSQPALAQAVPNMHYNSQPSGIPATLQSMAVSMPVTATTDPNQIMVVNCIPPLNAGMPHAGGRPVLDVPPVSFVDDKQVVWPADGSQSMPGLALISTPEGPRLIQMQLPWDNRLQAVAPQTNFSARYASPVARESQHMGINVMPGATIAMHPRSSSDGLLAVHASDVSHAAPANNPLVLYSEAPVRASAVSQHKVIPQSHPQQQQVQQSHALRQIQAHPEMDAFAEVRVVSPRKHTLQTAETSQQGEQHAVAGLKRAHQLHAELDVAGTGGEVKRSRTAAC